MRREYKEEKGGKCISNKITSKKKSTGPICKSPELHRRWNNETAGSTDSLILCVEYILTFRCEPESYVRGGVKGRKNEIRCPTALIPYCIHNWPAWNFSSSSSQQCIFDHSYLCATYVVAREENKLPHSVIKTGAYCSPVSRTCKTCDVSGGSFITICNRWNNSDRSAVS